MSEHNPKPKITYLVRHGNPEETPELYGVFRTTHGDEVRIVDSAEKIPPGVLPPRPAE